MLYINLGFGLPYLKSAWDLVYLGQKREVREILRIRIDCLEDWELEKSDLRKIKTLDWCIKGIYLSNTKHFHNICSKVLVVRSNWSMLWY